MQRLCTRAQNRKAAKKQSRENKNPTITKNTYGEKKTHSTGGKNPPWEKKQQEWHMRVGSLSSEKGTWWACFLAGSWLDSDPELQNKTKSQPTKLNQTKPNKNPLSRQQYLGRVTVMQRMGEETAGFCQLNRETSFEKGKQRTLSSRHNLKEFNAAEFYYKNKQTKTKPNGSTKTHRKNNRWTPRL